MLMFLVRDESLCWAKLFVEVKCGRPNPQKAKGAPAVLKKMAGWQQQCSHPTCPPNLVRQAMHHLLT